MKKINKKKVESVSENLVDNNEKLSQKQLAALLAELGHTNYFKAIQQYNEAMRLTLDQMLRVIDPVLEPGKMARHQGVYDGLTYLEDAIKLLIDKHKDGDSVEQAQELV